MKSKLLIIIVLCFTKMLFAQDTLRVTTEVDSVFTPPQYVSDFGGYFMEQLPVTKAIKIGFNLATRDYNMSYMRTQMGAEYKFGKMFSLNYAVETSVITPFTSFTKKEERASKASFYRTYLGFYIEPRWYFNKKKTVNNLNGTYISFKGAYQNGSGTFYTGYKNASTWITQLNFGLQRQTLDNAFSFMQPNRVAPGYFDMNIGLGLEFRANNSIKPTFQYQIIYGNVLSKLFGTSIDGLPSSKELRENDAQWYNRINKSNTYRYFDEKKQHFKIDLANLLNLYNGKSAIGEMSMAYERKLGKSPFTINAETNFQFGSIFNLNNGYLQSYTSKNSIEPRYFYKMKRGATLGETGNNLSGVFAGFQLGIQQQEWNAKNTQSVKDSYERKQYLSAIAVWGAQSYLTKHIFIESKIGLGAKTLKNKDLNFFKKYEFSYLLGDVKVGLAF